MSFERLVEKVRDNDVVLWVGAGFSLYAGMPNANKLRDLIIEHSAEEDKRYFENKNLADVASTFIDIRRGSKNELYQLLQSVIDIEPTSLMYHQLLAEIPQIDLIVTTNYDKLFEEAYGRDISTIVTDLHLPLATKRTKLYKIHGDIHMPDTMVLTNEDYTNFFRNQDKPLWNKIKTLLAEKTIIFLGYSLADQNIQYLFDNVISDIGSYIKESYLIAPDLPKHEVNRLTQKGANYINMTGEEFIEKLHDEIKKNS
ncbi:SIR2 family NAD-dependent protein deacylase [Lysinibacillus sp. NPDC098008]|uniref:SIR2 family NAD-dependent protein deacylase n=1 Tax=Lysinibacillus sp. NPDC098008 TaxID=3364146 RepID=UPI003808B4E5